MKKCSKLLIAIVLVVFVVATLSVALVACGHNHEHQFASWWSSDDTHHWHAAICGDTDEVRDMAEHVVENWTVIRIADYDAPGLEEGYCKECERHFERTIPQLQLSPEDVEAGKLFEFELLYGTSYKVTKYIGNASEAVIPDEYKNLPVSTIGNNAFENSSVTSIVVSKSVTSIDDHAFDDCSTLESITVMKDNSSFISLDGVIYNSSDRSIFYVPLALKGAITILDKCPEIGEGAFAGRTGLQEVTIVDSVMSIDESAFDGCTGLKSYIVSSRNPSYKYTSKDGVLYYNGSISRVPMAIEGEVEISGPKISDGAFADRTNLQKITISANVVSIGSEAFSGCTGLQTVVINERNGRNANIDIGVKAFSGCTGLKEVTLSEGVLTIGTEAFANCTSLTSIAIPASVIDILPGAFEGCTGLKSFSVDSNNKYYKCYDRVVYKKEGEYSDVVRSSYLVPKAIEGSVEIPYGCSGIFDFSDCTNLTAITIPSSVTEIGDNAFSGCTKLATVNWNAVNCKKASDIFKGCTALTTVNIAEWVQVIPSLGGTGLREITIPEEVKQIGSFSDCTELATVNWNAKDCSSDSNVFLRCTSLSTVNLGDKVQFISDRIFENCTGLKSITVAAGNTVYQSKDGVLYKKADTSIYAVPQSIEGAVTILDGCKDIYNFANCTNLTSITIPDSVTSIGNSAFRGCTGLQTVNWNATNCTAAGSSGYQIFNGCTGLTTVNIGENVQSIPANAFYGCTGITKVNVTSLKAWSEIEFGSSTANPLYETNSNKAGTAKLYLNDEEVTGDVNIPSETSKISNYAFYRLTGITSATIPEGVTSIGSSAFNGCTGLQAVTIPAGVQSIGYDAFYGCTGLSEITIPDSVTSIDYSAFFGCTNIATATYPASAISAIPKNSLTTVTITSGEIGDQAFYNHTKLQNVTIGEGVTSIGNSAFYNCTGITKVNVTSLKAWCEIEFGNSFANPLYVANNVKLYLNDEEVTGDVNIPSETSKISNYAFYGLTGITSITIPEGVQSIGDSAFEDCTGLQAVTIPAGVQSIDEYAFSGCTNIATATYPASAISAIPKNSLTTVTITSGEIGDQAFYNHTKLQNVTIGEGVTSIGGDAFRDCTGITKVNVTSLKAWCEIEFGNSFANPLYVANSNKAGTAKLYLNDEEVTGDVNIPSETSKISNYAFYGLTGITSATIPSSVTSIGSSAFNGCTGLQAVTIPAGVQSIDEYAFSGCTGITSITIPDSVTSIGSSAFYNCTGIIKVNYLGTLKGWCEIEVGNSYANPLYEANNNKAGTAKLYINEEEVTGDVNIPSGTSKIGSYAFYGLAGTTSITIPDSVTSIDYSAFFGCTNIATATYPASAISAIPKNSLTTVTITSGEIGRHAFFQCSGLQTVTIGEGVTSIGDGAFSHCEGLQTVTIGEGVTSIGDSAFKECRGITKVNYLGTLKGWCEIEFNSDANPLDGAYNAKLYLNDELVTEVKDLDGVTAIPSYAFYWLTDITSVTIPDSVTSIGYRAFYGCTGLSEITIPDSVTSIGEDAFFETPWYDALSDGVVYIGKVLYKYKGNMPQNTSINIQDGTVSISRRAFEYCTGLTEITIPDSVQSIGDRAFIGCTGLQTVTIGSSVTSIGAEAFYSCTNLNSVTFENPNGWYYTFESDYTGGNSISASKLQNASTAAQYLRSTYSASYYYWYRKEN